MQHPLTLSLPSSVTFQVPLFFKDASFFSFVFVCWLLSQSTTNNVKIRVFLLVLGLGYLLLNLKFFLLLFLKKNNSSLNIWGKERKNLKRIKNSYYKSKGIPFAQNDNCVRINLLLLFLNYQPHSTGSNSPPFLRLDFIRLFCVVKFTYVN